MTKPRVLQLVDSFNQGGSERQAVQLARLLHESGTYEVRVACLNNQGPLRAEIEALGMAEIQVFPLTSFHDVNFAVQLIRLVRYLRQNEISVVQSSDFYTNIFGMLGAKLAHVPVRIAVRREGGERSAFNRFVERGAYCLAQTVIANCETVRKELIAEGVREQKIITSYNGLNLAKFKSSQASRDELLASFGLQNAANRRLVVLVANLRPVKDQAMFLRAAQRVRAIVPDAAFCLAGEGELLEPLRQQAAQLGLADDVYFIGSCVRVAELLAVSDIGVLSSISEGFSNAIIEYMAAGLPVVVTDVGGAREAVVETETGFIVPLGDDELMAARIIELLSDSARARVMGQLARRRVEDRFSNAALLERTECLYDRLLERQSRPSRLQAVGCEKEVEGVNR